MGLFVGLATVDLTYVLDQFPARDQKISVSGQLTGAGGPSANAAATFAFLGGSATLVSAVGRHPLGGVIRDDLAGLQVRLHDLASARNEPPPVSSIMVLRDTGERRVVSANATVFSSPSMQFDRRWLDGISVVQVDGHYMSLCIATAKAARARRIPVVLDSGSWKSGMSKLLAFVDVVICSDDFRPPGCAGMADVFAFLTKRKLPSIAITRGASSICYLENGQRGEVPIKKVRCRDTLGAGDIFHGAFCYYAYGLQRGFVESLSAAAAVATFSCKHLGTRSWMKDFRP